MEEQVTVFEVLGVYLLVLLCAPALDVVGEQKTKPTQIGLRQLQQVGISPNVVICRSKAPKKVNAFLEIPKGSNIKYEYDEKNEVSKSKEKGSLGTGSFLLSGEREWHKNMALELAAYYIYKRLLCR